MTSSPKKYFRPDVLRQKAYHLSAYPRAIKLNQNELSCDLPPRLKRVFLQEFSRLHFNRYPLPQPLDLQKNLAKKLHVDPSQILFSNGSNVLIQALVIVSSVGKKVMGVIPSFSLYQTWAELLGNRFVGVELGADDFSLPEQKFLKVMKVNSPGLIFLPSPHAPTGTLFAKEDLLKIIEQAPGLVVIDEAYYPFSQMTLLPHLKKYPNLVIMRSFSKVYGLAGARVGYAVASKAVIEELSKVLLPYCVSSFSEAAASFVLKYQDYFDEVIAEIISERKKLFASMSKIPAIKVFPSEANYILFRVANAKKCFVALLQHGVLIRDVSDNHLLQNCLRVSIGKPKENGAFLKALRAVV